MHLQEMGSALPNIYSSKGKFQFLISGIMYRELFSFCYILLWINDLQPPYDNQERHPVFCPSKIQRHHAVVEISFPLKVQETKKK